MTKKESRDKKESNTSDLAVQRIGLRKNVKNAVTLETVGKVSVPIASPTKFLASFAFTRSFSKGSNPFVVGREHFLDVPDELCREIREEQDKYKTSWHWELAKLRGGETGEAPGPAAPT